ncbi:hypothetical protein [Vibrio harveyi]|nr:hypothetical protein [Vibrio harveyi]
MKSKLSKGMKALAKFNALKLALKELEKEIQQEQEKSFAEFIEQHSAS